MANLEKGWIEIIDNGYAQISVKLAGKTIPLRFTVSQQERLIEFQAKANEVSNSSADGNNELVANFLAKRTEQDLECCFIALNPAPDKIEYTREFIQENLDIDQIRLLSSVWMNRKVLYPSVTSLKKEMEISELDAKAKAASVK